MKDLTIIVPVYNEDEVIKSVLMNWVSFLKDLNIDFEIIVYNDGSKDNTLEKVNQVASKNKEVIAIDKKNSGHGPTIIQGYRDSLSKWVFQMDSDDEIKVNEFEKFWSARKNYDFIVGKRSNRRSPLSRKIITYVSRLTVFLLYGNKVFDVNCPFRLYRREKFQSTFNKIPIDTFAPNIILSGIASKMDMNVKEIEVEFFPRETGEVSIQKFKLLKVAIISLWQTLSYIFKK